jgi:predicted ATPase/DNA-binding CsgD family transcriptional regulator
MAIFDGHHMNTAVWPVGNQGGGRNVAFDRWLVSEGQPGLSCDLSDFVGRAHEIAEVAKLMKASPVVTLTGPSGIGKTRLALEVARRLQGDYPEGVWFVDLAPITDPQLVPQAVASAIGLESEPGRDPLDWVCNRLRARSALVVVDNCEHLVEACAELAERVIEDCNGISLLATSQRALEIEAERIATVPALSLPKGNRVPSRELALESDAIRLFCTRAAASHRGFRLTDEVLPLVAQICQRLDGIPLAIELAASRVAVLGPAEIAERLGERFRLLTQGWAGAPARHQTLRGALDWSHDLLSEREAVLFRRLSVFTGGMGLHAVEKVCSGDDLHSDHVVDLLTSLVAKSLLVADTTRPRARYHMLETIRAYARYRLGEAGEGHALSCRHATWCVALAEGEWGRIVAGDPAASLDTLEAEHDNLRAAMEWAIGADPGTGLRLVTALTPFWESRGYFAEGRQWLQRAVDVSEVAARSSTSAASPPFLHARALWGLGLMATLVGDFVFARPVVEQSLKLARHAGAEQAQAHALNLLGLISILTQDPLAGIPLLEESVALARSAGDASLTATALIGLGRARLFLSEIDLARAAFDECVALGVEAPIGALIGLARTALAAGEEDRARQLFDEVLPKLSEAGDRFETALVLSFVGELAWTAGDPATARARLEEGLELSVAMGAPFPRVRCLYGLARVAHTDGDGDAAVGLVNEACVVATSTRLPYALVRSLHARAGMRLASGDHAGAEKDYDDAVGVAQANSDRAGAARSLYGLAGVARARGACDEAMALLYDALTIQADIGSAGIPSSLEAMAGMGADQGRPARAARLFGAAEALRQAHGERRAPDEAAAYAADVAHLRSVLDSSELDEAWAQGGALSRPEAVALALRGPGARDRGRPSYGWASLTPAERQIADLVAEGLSNREIGTRLFISHRTVQGHLARVFAKLGVRSRREVREAIRNRSPQGRPA